MTLQLPPAPPKPCAECPWRLDATPGHLGPFDPLKWAALARSDEPVACHMTIPPGTSDLSPAEAWAQPEIRQCRGMGLYRVNTLKSPRNPTDVEHSIDVDDPLLATVFPTERAFVEHHDVIRVLQCLECSVLTIDDPDVQSFDECPSCGSDCTTAGTASLCLQVGSCDDPTHHYGLDRHVADDETP